MNVFTVVAAACGIILGAVFQPGMAAAQTGDEAQIRAVEDQFAAAFKAKDIDAIMKVYVPDESLFVFDVVPPRQYVGATAYRNDWAEFFKTLDGTPNFEITELAITVDGNLAFSHSIQHVAGKKPTGEPLDLTVRVTDAYRKIDGKWLIVHEHVSVPVDLDTGKPDLASKP